MAPRDPEHLQITQELKELGRHLSQTVRAVAGSDEVRRLVREIREGFKELTDEIEEAMEKTREREEVQQLRAQASRVADSVRNGEAQREIREEIADALHRLNEQLRVLVQRIRPQEDLPAPHYSSEGMPTVKLSPDEQPPKAP